MSSSRKHLLYYFNLKDIDFFFNRVRKNKLSKKDVNIINELLREENSTITTLLRLGLDLSILDIDIINDLLINESYIVIDLLEYGLSIFDLNIKHLYAIYSDPSNQRKLSLSRQSLAGPTF